MISSSRLPALAAAAALTLGASSLFAAEFALKDTAGDHLDVLSDGKIIARYM